MMDWFDLLEVQRAEKYVKGMISVSPDSCIFPYIEEHQVPKLEIPGVNEQSSFAVLTTWPLLQKLYVLASPLPL